MKTDGIALTLSGSDAVVQWFGGWPSFHDAEVIGLNLVRTGESRLRIYPYYPDKPATVDFILEKITDVELADFSGQNVISSLTLETFTDQTNQNAVRLTLSPCYGLAGRIDAQHVRVELAPGKSPDGVSLW
jgi:Immunity protein 50